MVPYSNVHPVTFPPLGLTVAFRVTEVCASTDADPVTTVGELGGLATPLMVTRLRVGVVVVSLVASCAWYCT